jgi:hypothetical protein
MRMSAIVAGSIITRVCSQFRNVATGIPNPFRCGLVSRTTMPDGMRRTSSSSTDHPAPRRTTS